MPSCQSSARHRRVGETLGGSHRSPARTATAAKHVADSTEGVLCWQRSRTGRPARAADAAVHVVLRNSACRNRREWPATARTRCNPRGNLPSTSRAVLQERLQGNGRQLHGSDTWNIGLGQCRSLAWHGNARGALRALNRHPGAGLVSLQLLPALVAVERDVHGPLLSRTGILPPDVVCWQCFRTGHGATIQDNSCPLLRQNRIDTPPIQDL